MNRQTALIFYVLSVYVVVQFGWWGYHLIELTQEVSAESDLVSKRITMVVGEGAVFLVLLVIGLWKIKRSISKEQRLTKRQKNFLLSVTHELKTPLAANKLYLQTIAKRDLSEEKKQELLSKAIEENVRLENMIDKILNASRLENKAIPLVKEKVDLKELLHAIGERYRSIYPDIKFNLDLHAISLSADLFLFESMVNNLMENAVKYGDNSDIHLKSSIENDQIIIQVSDHGPGIDEKIRAEMFKKFVRAGDEDTRTSKGTGLGLYIVQEIALLHNGTVTYSNNIPKGSLFKITIRNDR